MAYNDSIMYYKRLIEEKFKDDTYYSKVIFNLFVTVLFLLFKTIYENVI